MKVVAVKAPGGLERLVVETRADPRPAAGEVLVRVRASSLNYHDYAVAAGKIPAADGRIPMSDGAGEVVEVGAGVTAFRPGERVISLFHPRWPAGGPSADALADVPGEQVDGFAAEYVSAPASALTRAPAGWSFAEAATLPCAALTAWRALIVEARIRPGQWVLTQGTGGVSIFALQFAKAAGARVIATSGSDEKLDRLRALGADHLINYRQTPDWGRAAAELTGGRGVDAVVDIGGAGTLAQSVQAARIGGHVSLIGVLAGWAGQIPLVPVTLKNIRLQGLSVGSRHEQERMVAALEATGVRPVIDSCFPLEEIARAFAHQESQTHFGKICLEF